MRGDAKKLRKVMVEHLVKEGYIRTERVERAMLEVPREIFLPEAYRSLTHDA